ncbi:dihydrodipicolinate synthase family protein [Halegenticoccus soli]|uniref:dihydrodipicolinate synthase family protein n=1 Tax=Halegenticoccus soli TaxID=1985678 RepID=UPI000C6CE9B0|nr:dihydrodipicolinate synthase family protein [Halegenticoccus soli]
MPKSETPEIEGALCPLVTPFADGAVDHERLEAVIDYVLAGGIDGLVPCGTTGEFASLTDDEYRAVLETTVDRAGDAPIVAGTADTSVEATLDRIAVAAEIGADAALVTLPFFHTANDPAGNVAFIEAVADDSSLPLYLYNIPACTGQEIQPSVVAEVAGHDAVLGLKDSGGDFDYFASLLRRTPDEFRLLQGFDSYLVPGTLLGGSGGINALSNVIPEVYAAAAEAARDGDLERARHLQSECIGPLFEACVEHGFAPATKTALVARDVVPSAAVRPPLVELDDEAEAELADTVDRVVAAASSRTR